MHKKYSLIVFIFLVSACTSLEQLERLNKASPPKEVSAFNIALAKEYQILAEDEARELRNSNSVYFARKGIAALKGVDIVPEPLADWPIDKAESGNLIWAAKRIDNILIDPVKEDYPLELAQVIKLYDCWIASYEYNKLRNDCRMDFVLSISALEEMIMPFEPQNENVTTEKKVIFAKDIFFDFAESSINKKGIQGINETIKALKGLRDYKVKIDAYTDTTGDASFNEELSKRRAVNVANKLIAKGVSKKKIEKHAHGENNLIFPTKDNTSQKLNRKVTIGVWE